MISAKIIADSINTHGQRLTTFVLVFPRIVLAEFNTHRMISRNSASSRAIPFEKMVDRVKADPFIPIRWMKDHPGMQGTEYITDPKEIEWLNKCQIQMANNTAIAAEYMHEKGVTKQICNRYLEPYMWHTVIATGTEWENFFSLRAHEAAEIHIQDLAYKMLEQYNHHAPTQLLPGEWHIPFGDQIDTTRATFLHTNGNINEIKLKIATARCARISYNTFEGKDDYEADIKLHDRLASSGHWSPFEHCARAMSWPEMNSHRISHTDLSKPASKDKDYIEIKNELGWCGNFRGFIQYRKLFNSENRTDDRVRKASSEHITNTKHREEIGSAQTNV